MNVKKVTKRDRYGNQFSLEFDVPKMDGVPEHHNDGGEAGQGHPGEPQGEDTVPAWLTPGEYVINKEAVEALPPGFLEQLNDIGLSRKPGGFAKNKQEKMMNDGGHLNSGGAADNMEYYRSLDAMRGFLPPSTYNQYDAKDGSGWFNPKGRSGVGYLKVPESGTPHAATIARHEVGHAYDWNKNLNAEQQKDIRKNYKRDKDKTVAFEKSASDIAGNELNDKYFPLQPEQQQELDRKLDTYKNHVRYKNDGGEIPQPQSYANSLLRSREGYSDKVYNDSLGKPTVGTGHHVPGMEVGSQPYSPEENDQFLTENIELAELRAMKNVGPATWMNLNRQQQGALTSQAFQLGGSGQAGFKKMLAAVQSGDNAEVAKQALDSKWARQTPKRAQDLADAFGTPNASPLEREEIVPQPIQQHMPEPPQQRPEQLTNQDIDDLDADIYNTGGPVMYKNDGGGIQSNFMNRVHGTNDGSQVTNQPSYGNSNIVPEIKAGGHAMFGGNQNLSGGQFVPPPNFGNYQPTLGDHGGAGPVQPSEEWRKSYDPTHPENVPMITQQKADLTKQAIINAEKVAADSDPTDPMFETKLNYVKELKGELAADNTKLDQKAVGEANIAENIANEKRIENTDSLAELQAIQDEAAITGDTTTMDWAEGKINTLKEANEFEESMVTEVNNTDNKDDESEVVVAKADPEQYDELDQSLNDGAFADAEGPGSDQKGDNKSNSELLAEGKKAAADDPEGTEGIADYFKDAFKDLFDPKELARMAIMYAGSRALGYGHEGSLKHGLKTYMGRLDSKATAKASAKALIGKRSYELAKSDKFDMQSIKNFQASDGDYSQLIPKGVAGKKSGTFKEFYSKNGQTIRAEQVDYNGQKVWVDTVSGKQLNQAQVHENADEIKGSPEWNKTITTNSTANSGILEGLQKRFDESGKDSNDKTMYNTQIIPKLQSRKIAEWAVANKIPQEQMGAVIEQAYHSAIQYAKANPDNKVRDLVPFIKEQVIQAKTGDPSLFKSSDGNPISVKKVTTQSKSIARLAQIANPNLKGSETTISSAFYQSARTDWTSLSDKDKKQWNAKAESDESGFYKFVDDYVAKKFNK